MKKYTVVLLLGVWMLTGCAHYVITLNNGSRIDTKSKPKLKNGIYVYRDALGRDSYVPAGRVREVAPASMAKGSGANFGASSK